MQLLDIERQPELSTEEDLNPRASAAARRVYIETYGCQMNVSDTELMMGVLKKAGFRTAIGVEDADVVLLNTCAIRERAEERVVGRLSQLSQAKRSRPDLVLGVSGCMAKHLAEQLLNELPYVDLVVGPDSYRRLPELIGEASGNPALGRAARPPRGLSGTRPRTPGGYQRLDHDHAGMRQVLHVLHCALCPRSGAERACGRPVAPGPDGRV